MVVRQNTILDYFDFFQKKTYKIKLALQFQCTALHQIIGIGSNKSN